MRYLILIQSNPRSLAAWDRMSDDERRDFGQAHLRISAEMEQAGVLVVSEGLADPALARWVSVRDDKTIVSDGPFAESKEHLAGFYLIDCAAMEEALAWAARMPDAKNVEVEVRPVLDMSGWEF